MKKIHRVLALLMAALMAVGLMTTALPQHCYPDLEAYQHYLLRHTGGLLPCVYLRH